MANQIMRRTLYHSVYGVSDDVLEHHGVEGQEWGEKNGPPYPLSGANKRHAIKEWMENKKKKKRIEKLQKAAKKARKERKKEKEEQEAIAKKKQKLVKKGDMDKIKKNAKLFTNEELEYIAERERAKASVKTKEEVDADERFERAMKRMGQIADIASKGAQIFNAGKAGADMIASLKSAKLKDLEADEKFMKKIKDEFDVRSRIDQTSAVEWFNNEMTRSGREGVRMSPRAQQGPDQNQGSQTQRNNQNNRQETAQRPERVGNQTNTRGESNSQGTLRSTVQNHLGSEWVTTSGGLVNQETNTSGREQPRRLQGSYTRSNVNTSAYDTAYANRQERMRNMNSQTAASSSNSGRRYVLAGRNAYRSPARSSTLRSTVQNHLGSEWVTTSGGLVLPVAVLDGSQASGTQRNYESMNRSGRHNMDFI